jgi:hypothetical protein
VARWTASAKWAAGPALDGRRDMLLELRLNEGLGHTRRVPKACIRHAAMRPKPMQPEAAGKPKSQGQKPQTSIRVFACDLLLTPMLGTLLHKD